MLLTAMSPVGVVGSGTMGAGIAQIAALAGHPVLLLDAVAGRARVAITGIGRQLERLVVKDRLAAPTAAPGATRAVALLDALNQAYPTGRYRACPRLRRLAWTGGSPREL